MSILQQHKLIFGIGCGLLYLALLCSRIPAAQALRAVDLPTGITLQQVAGTVWDGSVNAVGINGLVLQRIRWQLHFSHLLLGRVNADVTIGTAENPADMHFTGNITIDANQGLTLTAGNFQLPTNMVIARIPLPVPVLAEGHFLLSEVALEYQLATGTCAALTARGEWINAAVQGTQGMIALGDFAANVSCPKGELQLVVEPANSLNLSATAQLSSGGKLRVSGKFQPDGTLPAEVQQAAALMGKADSNGYYSINIQ